jgi:hypothetical protein
MTTSTSVGSAPGSSRRATCPARRPSSAGATR